MIEKLKLKARDYFEKGHIPLCVMRRPYEDAGCVPHSHNFRELMVVIGGMAMHHINGKDEEISMGDVYVVPPGQVHSYDVPRGGGVEVLNVMFDLNRLNLSRQDIDLIPGFHALFLDQFDEDREPQLKLAARDLAVVNSIIEEIEREQEEMAPGYEFLCVAKFRELMVVLSRRYSHISAHAGSTAPKVAGVIAHMERHLDEELDFESLVGVSGMSGSSLRRVFKEAFGCSPMSYLQKLRIQKAMLLLSDPSKTISEVAFEVGFNGSGYFSRVFKEETGESPGDFRTRVLHLK